MCFPHPYPLKTCSTYAPWYSRSSIASDYQVVLGQRSAATVRGAPFGYSYDRTSPARCGITRDPCQSCSLAIWKLERKRSVQRDYGVPNQGFGRYSIKALQQDQELDWAWSGSAKVVFLNHNWTPLPDVSGLFECVAKLQYAPVVMMAANDLNTDRKPTRRERAGN